MPIYVEISPLHRLVTIVARGTLTSDEVSGSALKLADARVRRFAKIVEVAGAHLDLAPADIAQLAQTLRGDPDKRGPIAFVVATTPPQGAPPNPDAAWTMLGGMGLFYLVVFLVSIVIAVLFFFTFPLIADRNMKGVQAVRTSIRAATANLGGVIGLVLLTQLMSFVGSLACCIGAIFVLPIHFAAVAIAYRKVFPQEVMSEQLPSDEPEAD